MPQATQRPGKTHTGQFLGSPAFFFLDCGSCFHPPVGCQADDILGANWENCHCDASMFLESHTGVQNKETLSVVSLCSLLSSFFSSLPCLDRGWQSQKRKSPHESGDLLLIFLENPIWCLHFIFLNHTLM